MKILKSLSSFICIAPLLLSACKHVVKYKEFPLLDHYVFLTTEDMYLRPPDSSCCLPFMKDKLKLTYVKINNRDIFLHQGSKIGIAKIYAVYMPTFSAPIPSTYRCRCLICLMVDLETKKQFWTNVGYKELSVDLQNQVRSVEIDRLQFPHTGKSAIINVPLNIWDESDMIEFTLSFN